MLTVGVVGCGAIGSELCHVLQRTYARVARIVALHDQDISRAQQLQRTLDPPPECTSLTRLIARSHVVVEAASVQVAADVVCRALRAHRDVLVMSIGGLLLHQTWRRLMRASRGRLFLPSGALAGLDGLLAMATGGGLRQVTLTTHKPPRALADAPYVRTRRLQLAKFTRPKMIFNGTPHQVIRAFPQNTNVAARVWLAAQGLDLTRPARQVPVRVRVVADPRLTRNVHELVVEGETGRLQCRVESRPSRNPKTSELAIRSAQVTLQRMLDPVLMGS